MSFIPQATSRRDAGGQPEWLTLGQAAHFLGVAQSTIRKWSDTGRVPAFYTPGGHRRYRREDLDRFVAQSGPSPRESVVVSTVLVVDDDSRVREFLRVSLEVEGFSVREAGDGAEALASIEEFAPDLVLLDVVMPGIDGWEMLRRMQELHGAIPVILFSGQLDHASLSEAARRGASGAIGKPFDPQALVERVRQVLAPN
jgi:excisionase family DNA binding protein